MDLISRQDAIDAVASYLYKVCLALHNCMTPEESKECATCVLQSVPSAQPEVPDTNVGDMISRQAAIDEMKNMYEAAEKWGREATDDVIKARAESCMASLIEMKLRIEKLPSAEPEPSQVARDIATIIENEKDMRVIRTALDDSNTHNTLEALEQRWIPCSEKLPDESKWYIISNGLDSWVAIWSKENKEWLSVTGLDYTIMDVVAWMEFPEAYREDGDSDGE